MYYVEQFRAFDPLPFSSVSISDVFIIWVDFLCHPVQIVIFPGKGFIAVIYSRVFHGQTVSVVIIGIFNIFGARIQDFFEGPHDIVLISECDIFSVGFGFKLSHAAVAGLAAIVKREIKKSKLYKWLEFC